MPDGSIPCPVCGNYDNTHKVSCHRGYAVETSVTCLVCGSNMDYSDGYYCKNNCESEYIMPLTVFMVDDDVLSL